LTKISAAAEVFFFFSLYSLFLFDSLTAWLSLLKPVFFLANSLSRSFALLLLGRGRMIAGSYLKG
jgi:hypothetical protein